MVEVLEGEIPVEFPEPADREALDFVKCTFCWVLGHDSGEGIQTLLEDLNALRINEKIRKRLPLTEEELAPYVQLANEK